MIIRSLIGCHIAHKSIHSIALNRHAANFRSDCAGEIKMSNKYAPPSKLSQSNERLIHQHIKGM